MKWIREMIFDGNNQAEKSVLAFLGFFVASGLAVASLDSVGAFLAFSAACLGITAWAAKGK